MQWNGGDISSCHFLYVQHCEKEMSVLYLKYIVPKGCKEFVGDCELDNVGSLKFHLSMGFKEATDKLYCMYEYEMISDRRLLHERKK